MKLKKGDKIVITSGKDKGKKGKIEKLFLKDKTVLVPGFNVYKRHLKKRDEKNPGGIIEFSRPLPVANIAFLCPKCEKVVRVGYKLQGGEKFRVCRKCDQII